MRGTIFEQIERLEKMLNRVIIKHIERDMSMNDFFIRIIHEERGWHIKILHLDNNKFCPELHDRYFSEFMTTVINPNGELARKPNESVIRQTAYGCANMLLITLCMN